MPKLKLTTIGSSVGEILPKEALPRLKVEKGDSVFSYSLGFLDGNKRTAYVVAETFLDHPGLSAIHSPGSAQPL